MLSISLGLHLLEVCPTSVLNMPIPPFTSAPTTIPLSTKFRDALNQADAKNPWIRPYMKAVRPWQPSTLYRQGYMVVNGGNLYVNYPAGSGTSASSGGPTLTTIGNNADGTTAWFYYGPNIVTIDPSMTVINWSAGLVVSLGQIISTGTKVYAVVSAGITGVTAPTGTSNSVTDGTAILTYTGPYYVNPYANDFPTVTYAGTSTGVNQYFPANYPSSYPATVSFAQPIAGGSGYAVNDTITISGGTFTNAAVLKVTSVSSGAVTGVSVNNAGAYTVLPAGIPATQASTSGSGTGATFALVFPDPFWASLRNCYQTSAQGSTAAYQYTFQPTNNCTPLTQYVSLEFETDAPKVCIQQLANISLFSITIDGVKYSLDGLNYSTSTQFITFDFTTTSGRKTRKWRIDSQGQAAFSSVFVDAGSTIWKPQAKTPINAVFISDSILQGSGYGPFISGNSLALRVGQNLGWTNAWSFSQGGTGYVARGSSPAVTTDSYNFRVAEAARKNPDIWVLMGSTNDISLSGVTTAVTSLLASIRSYSSATIVVLGVLSVNKTGLGTTESQVQAGVTSFNDPNTYFIPIYYDSYLPWITGSWNNNPAPSGNTSNPYSSNNTVYIASDGIHPVDLGTQYLANRITQAIQQLPIYSKN
jgi:hypothetical protein